MVTNLASRLIPAIGDFGYDDETAKMNAILGYIPMILLSHPVTHVYSDQGWVRIRNISTSWVARNIDKIEAALGAGHGD